jgi:type IV pilus assembly protein PilM
MFNLSQKPFGLDISDYSIEIVSLGGSIEKPSLLAMAGATLGPGVVEDSQILNKEKLKDALENLMKNPDFGRIKTKKLIFSIPESKTFVHIFKLPQGLNKQKEREFINSQAEKVFPYSLKELCLDFRISEKEVFLAAVPQNIINGFLEVFKSCQLQPLALDIESASLATALIDKRDVPVLIVDIGTRTSDFSVFNEKGLRISISFEVAGNSFTQVLSEKLKISFQEAEILKREIGLNPGPKQGKVFLILQKEIQAIIQQIREIGGYFWQKEGRKIEKIILAGGSAMLPHLPEYLSDNLEKEVTVGDPWQKINIDILKKKEYFKKALQINPVLYSTVVGSALRGLAKNPQKAGINLLKAS